MIIQLEKNISQADKDIIIRKIQSLGYKTIDVTTQKTNYLVGIGKKEFDIRQLGQMKGMADIHRVSDDYKLVSRKWKVNYTQLDLDDGIVVGDRRVTLFCRICICSGK